MVNPKFFKAIHYGETNLKSQGDSKVFLMSFKVKNNKAIGRNQLNKYIKKKLIPLGKQKDADRYRVMVNATFPDRTRTNTGGFQPIKHFKLPNPEEDYGIDDDTWINKITSFRVYFTKLPPKKEEEKDKEGGNTRDNKNDCLFMALFKAFDGNIKNFKRASRMKSFLDLERNEKIHIDKLDILEAELKTELWVKGDYDRIPKNNYPRSVVLNLRKQHYTLSDHNSKKLLKGLVFDDKSPLFYKYDDNKNKYKLYDGKDITFINADRLYDMIGKQTREPHSYQEFYVESKTRDIVKEYNDFIMKADLLKKETKEKFNVHCINLYQVAGKYNRAIHKLFYNKTRCYNPESIDYFESKFIDDAFIGAIIWGVKNKVFDNAFCYDFNSMYQYILRKYSFPIKAGTWHKLDKLPEILSYGLYRCKIYIKDKRLMRLNNKNTYTFLDIKRARELNYKIELIKDGSFNALLYKEGQRVYGLFRNSVDELFKIRKTTSNKILEKEIKKLQTRFWGGLCEKNKYTRRINLNSKESLDLTENPLCSLNTTETEHLAKFYDSQNLFKYDYARMGPFITAYGRYIISREIEPHLKDKNGHCQIVRVHTDGFVSTNKLDVKLSDKLGELKLEASGKCNIINGARKPLFNFIEQSG